MRNMPGKDSRIPEKKATRADFTLIELLIVVAVIAVLMALLLPALNSAKESSKKIVCLGNEKQLGLAFAMYASESNDWLPNSTSAEITQLGSWCYMLAPYANINWPASSYWPKGGMPIFYCPSALLYTDASGNTYENRLYNLSYGYNRFHYDPDQLRCVRMSKISKPSLCLLVGDLQYIGGTAPLNMSSWVSARVGQRNELDSWNPSFQAFRHNKQIDMLFVDGHATSATNRGDGYPKGFYFFEGGAIY